MNKATLFLSLFIILSFAYAWGELDGLVDKTDDPFLSTKDKTNISEANLTHKFSRDVLKYVPEESFADFGYGCQVYTIENKNKEAITTDIPKMYKGQGTSNIKNDKLEYYDSTKSKYEKTTKEATYNKGVTKYKYCAEYDMRPLPEGGWGARVDVIPFFDNYTYSEYAWWNTTWEKCVNINISGSFPSNYTHLLLLNNSNFNFGNAKSDLTDFRFYEGTCDNYDVSVGRLGMWDQIVRNDSDNTSYIWFKTVNPNVANVALYYNNTAAADLFNGTEAFQYFATDNSSWTLDVMSGSCDFTWNATEEALQLQNPVGGTFQCNAYYNETAVLDQVIEVQMKQEIGPPNTYLYAIGKYSDSNNNYRGTSNAITDEILLQRIVGGGASTVNSTSPGYTTLDTYYNATLIADSVGYLYASLGVPGVNVYGVDTNNSANTGFGLGGGSDGFNHIYFKNYRVREYMDPTPPIVVGSELDSSYPPTHGTPILNSTTGANFTTENLTVYNQSTQDPNNLTVKSIIDWRLDGNSIDILNMPFEGGAVAEGGLAIRDYSQYGHNGTIQDAPWVPGISGNGLGFDGINDNVDVPNSNDDFNFDLDRDFTISFWVKHDNVVPTERVISSGSSGLTIDMSLGKPRLFFELGTGYLIKTSSAISATDWNHVLFKVDRDVGTEIYVNGVNQSVSVTNGNQLNTTNISTSADLQFGIYGTQTSLYLDGILDEMTIYDCSLNTTEISNLNDTPGYEASCSGGAIISSWKFNETEGVSVLDSSGNNNGTIEGFSRPYFNATGGYDSFGAYEFDGDDTIQIQKQSTMSVGNESFTVVFWTKPGTNPVQANIIDSSNLVPRWEVDVLSTNRITGHVHDGTGPVTLSDSSSMNVDQWYHIAVVFDREANMTIYKDGVSVASTDMSSRTGSLDNSYDWYIGSNADSNLYYNGTVDDIAVYTEILTEEQILALYNNRTDRIVSDMTEVGDDWSACTTPNNGLVDGETKCSNNLTVLEYTPASINVTLPTGRYETEDSEINVTINSVPGDNITAFNASIHYNNTEVAYIPQIGLNTSTVDLNTSIRIPLIETNETNITWEVYANVTTDTGSYQVNSTGNDTILIWYTMDKYIISKTYNITTEYENPIDVSVPNRPTLASEDVNYSANPYLEGNCTKIYANGSTSIVGCNASLLSVGNISEFTILPSHLQEDGLIAMEYHIDRDYAMDFAQGGGNPEATSYKMLSESDINISLDYFVWIVNSINGSINGTDNISSFLNVTFYDEEALTSLTIDSVAATYVVNFTDGESKTYYISYATAVTNSTVRGFPNWDNFSVSSVEVYSKSGYTTRSRFLVNSLTDFSNLTNISIYFLPLSNSSYSIINVVDQGDAVVGAYIQILKYYASSNLYINVDQKITNSDGKAAAYLDVDAYYKFAVYDGDGTLLYLSTQPEQFILNSGVYEITIDISNQQSVDLTGTYISSFCYGNNTSNSIVYTFADVTGKSDSIRFLAYRTNVTTPVCNYTISGSSGGWVCTLPAGENLSDYAYTCTVEHTNSPFRLDYVGLIDFRIFNAVFDWQIIALVTVVTLAATAVHIGIGIALASISLFALSALNIVQINLAVSLPILVVGLVLSYLLLRRD